MSGLKPCHKCGTYHSHMCLGIHPASTIPASEAGELPTLDEHAEFEAWSSFPFDHGGDWVKAAYAGWQARAALASTRTASEQEIVTAGDRMARWLYGLSQSEAMPESWRTTCEELAQAWKGAVSGEVNAGAAAGGNTCKESAVGNSTACSPFANSESETMPRVYAKVDVEAEREAMLAASTERE